MKNSRGCCRLLWSFAVLCFVGGCERYKAAPTPPEARETASVQPSKTDAAKSSTFPPWRSDERLLQEKLAQVKKGWTARQLRKYAGAPDKQATRARVRLVGKRTVGTWPCLQLQVTWPPPPDKTEGGDIIDLFFRESDGILVREVRPKQREWVL